MSHFDLAASLTLIASPSVALSTCASIQIVLTWLQFYTMKDLYFHIVGTALGVGFGSVFREENNSNKTLHITGALYAFVIGVYSRPLGLLFAALVNFGTFDCHAWKSCCNALYGLLSLL